MVAARIVAPHTKLATTRWWHTTTLAEDFSVDDANENELYAAMDWLLARQDAIEKKLAARHLGAGGLVLYDLSSSYFEGSTCPLAKLGYNRDGRKGKLQVNYGLLTDARGCPVAVSVHEGNVADSMTLMPAVKRLREDFGIEQLVMVGDRGMISQKAIDEMRNADGIGWITALKSASIRVLVEDGHLQLGLFDERNLDRTQLAGLSRRAPGGVPQSRTGQAAHPQARGTAAGTERRLDKIKARVGAAKLAGADEIGLRVGKVVNQYKVAKHFELAIGDHSLSFARKHDGIYAEAALDGIYIIGTSVPMAQMDAPECVRNYKSLANVERAFRSLKTIDLKVRPIHHRTADRVRAHIFLCMLAYYVEWHMRRGLARNAVRRYRPTGQVQARSRGPGQTLQSGTGQGRQPHPRRRHAGAQLRHVARRTRHHRAQHLPRAPHRARCADIRGLHHPQREARARSTTCFSRSGCRQKPEPRSQAKCLSRMESSVGSTKTPRAGTRNRSGRVGRQMTNLTKMVKRTKLHFCCPGEAHGWRDSCSQSPWRIDRGAAIHGHRSQAQVRTVARYRASHGPGCDHQAAQTGCGADLARPVSSADASRRSGSRRPYSGV